MWSQATLQLISSACEEDLGSSGDLTSALLNESSTEVTAHLATRRDGVICGLALGAEICAVFSKQLGCRIEFEIAGDGKEQCDDGQSVTAGQILARLIGPNPAVLTTERTLLNFIGRMSGVATLTHQYVETARAANSHVHVLDTRKTLPGWRELDKYAVRQGGGHNHRMGLYDAILIKDNHLAGIPTDRLASNLTELLKRKSRAAKFVEIEVDRLDQLREVCRVPGVDIILLDNFSTEQMREAVDYRECQDLRGKVELEASGNVTLETIADIAATGVDRISVGALTHSAVALDVGLDF